ncbi:MAG TPA: ABC transporter ATP-binding protein [Syntrophomonadaceae bacterium]|nr:ABC transporter ATP-binding protein [Syntrophomonadaceae bacterium]
MSENRIILEVKGLKKYFPIHKGDKTLFVKAIDGIDFEVREGETVGLVGESGSGKSTTAYCVIGMYSVTNGTIMFKGKDISCASSQRPLELKRDMQIVFQDPGTSLNPQHTIYKIIELPLKVHGLAKGREMRERIVQLLESVELPESYLYKYPRMIGGGERQMVAIARALATNPSFMILDEPTSSLDVSVQAKIINMLIKLQKEFNLSYLFITHDLSLMRNVATRVVIMYLGKIAEMAPTEIFFQSPQHPYTQMLLSSIPVVTKEEEELKPKKIKSQGEIPSPVNVPPGCSFNTRCPLAKPECFEKDPVMVQVGPDHFVRCNLFA